MDRLDAMTLFVAAVDDGSLAAAARHHGRSPAAVTRAVAWLEQEAGERLLLRSTRKLGLTPAGEYYVAAWRDVLARLAELATVADDTLRGVIRLTAPEIFGRLHVMPIAEGFAEAHPEVSLRVLLRNRVVDLIGEGVNLAVRLAPLPPSNLVAVGIGTIRTLLCAAPSYLERAGVPNEPAGLERHVSGA